MESKNFPRFGLYLHVPFCRRKCFYCDFLSRPASEFKASERAEIPGLIEKEIELAFHDQQQQLAGRTVSTIYFGGGTPSLLHPAEIDRLIGAVERVVGIERSSCEEITIECNPVAADMERLRRYVDVGINRVSLGVQSFDDEVLKNLGRSHSSEEALQACLRLSDLDLRSWSLDLIFGAPYPACTEGEASQKDRRRFCDDLDQAIALDPLHMSVYGLTVHEGTALMDMVAQGSCCLPAEETQREQFLKARRALSDAGYRHYEISNYAKPGHESRHNSLYWTGGEYLGVGPGAHSFFGEVRRANPPDIELWREILRAGQWPAQAEEPPDIPSLRGERIMLALRRLEGVSAEQLDRMIGGDFATVYAETLDELKRRGLVRWDGRRLRLSEEGLLFSDTVFETFF